MGKIATNECYSTSTNLKSGKEQSMNKKILVTVFVVFVAAFQDISAAGESLSGKGTWQSDSGGSIHGTWSAEFVRSGTGLSGEFVIVGSPLFTGGRADGSLTDDDIVLGVIVSDTAQATFKGNLRGEFIEGSWDLPEISDTGTWEGSLR